MGPKWCTDSAISPRLAIKIEVKGLLGAAAAAEVARLLLASDLIALLRAIAVPRRIFLIDSAAFMRQHQGSVSELKTYFTPVRLLPPRTEQNFSLKSEGREWKMGRIYSGRPYAASNRGHHTLVRHNPKIYCPSSTATQSRPCVASEVRMPQAVSMAVPLSHMSAWSSRPLDPRHVLHHIPSNPWVNIYLGLYDTAVRPIAESLFSVSCRLLSLQPNVRC